MTKVNPNNGNETKSEIFHGVYSNLTSYFNDFYDCHLSISLQKLAQTSKVKQNQREHAKSDSIFLYLQSSAPFK